MNAEQLRQYLIEHGLERIADELVKIARPGIRIHTHPATEEEIPVGSSKMGGLPDLPIGTDWPVSGVPMAFIGQFNLAEVHPFDQENLLPESGLLSFFYKEDIELDPEDDWQDDWRVLYFDADPMQFVRRQYPANLDEYFYFHACKVSFEVALTLPEVDLPPIASIGLTFSERNDLIGHLIYINENLNLFDLNRPVGQPFEMVDQLLGYPIVREPGLFASVEYRASLRTGNEVHSRSDNSGHLKWCSLLQVKGSDDLGMDWGGSPLQYFIRNEDLKNRDFSQTYAGIWYL